MLEVKIIPEWIKEAEEKSKEMGILKHSISEGKGNVLGFIGEQAVLSVLKEGKLNNTYDYDIITPNGTIDVKTKRCRSVPQPHYVASVAAYNTRQRCTYYVFVRMFSDYSRCWVCGWIEKEKFFDRAKFLKQGEEDGDNGYIVKDDCYNLAYEKMNDIEFFS